jgi:phosphatidylserine/phosphatidylglycerophosphate/cardiolipin synthase-like enzyme
MANPKDFFLPEVKGDYSVFRNPLNTATKIERLIDGLNVFKSQEEAILAARDTILFVTWSFEPQMPVVSASAKKVADTWGQLLLSVASKASVRILMTDKDPIFLTNDHEAAWFRYRLLMNIATAMNVDQEDFQVAVARHPADWPLGVIGTATANQVLNSTLNATKGKDKKQVLREFENAPGLWGLIDPIAGTQLKQPSFAIPGSHHAKVLIIDEQIAFVGGINHITDNIDNQKHDMRAAALYQWHDGALKLQGKIVADVVNAAFQMWNRFHPLAAKFVIDANKQALPGMTVLPTCNTTDLTPIGAPDKPPRDGPIGAQIWRTVCGTIVSDKPSTTCQDISLGYIRAIGLAEKFIYIENQYLRDDNMADALIARAKAVKDLNIVILLPATAEEVILANAVGGQIDPITRQGVNLQHDIIQRLMTALGPNLGIFSPMAVGRTMPIKSPKTGVTTNVNRSIYVHTKLMIVDDVFATLGSANANPRSFELDTEINLAWHDTASVRGLRNELWREMLGQDSGADSWAPKRYAANWSKIASANAKLKGKTGWQGFIVPYDNGTSFPPVPQLIIPNWLTRADPSGDGIQIA